MNGQDDETQEGTVVVAFEVDERREIIRLVFDGDVNDSVVYNAHDKLVQHDEMKNVKNAQGNTPRDNKLIALLNCDGGTLEFNSIVYEIRVPKKRKHGQKSDWRGGGTKMPDLFVEDDSFSSAPQDLVNKKLDELITNLDDCNSVGNFASFLTIVQSSGYGKTRTVLDVARKRRVVYFLCDNISGGLERPPVVREFINSIYEGDSTKQSQARAEKLLDCVRKCAAKFRTPTELFDSQFDNNGDFKKGKESFYSLLHNELEDATIPLSPQIPIQYNDAESHPTKSPPEKTHQATYKTPSQNDDNKDPLIVVFDEAKKLTRDDPDKHSPYRCIRRALKGHNLVGVFMDTTGKLAEFMPEAASSDRDVSPVGKFLPPLFELNTFDLFKDHLFFRGRPLWKMQWEYRCEKNYNELIKFAGKKLLFSERPDDNSLCSLFICRFGLQPEQEMAHSLVAKHMATLVAVSDDRKEVVIKYKSEPILAEASAYLTSSYSNNDDTTLQNVVDKVTEKLNSGILSCDKGDRGEVAGAALLGYILDGIRSKDSQYDAFSNNLSREVGVLDFLAKVYHPGTISPDAETKLGGWEVNFTHFQRLNFVPYNKDILQTCWDQHAGLYLPAGEEGLDLLLAMCKEGEYASIRVQIKNYRNAIGNTAAIDYLNKLDPRRCAPRCEEKFSIGLLLQVGVGKMERICEIGSVGRQTRRQTSASSSQQLRVACSASESFNYISKLAGSSRNNSTEASTNFRDGAFAIENFTDS